MTTPPPFPGTPAPQPGPPQGPERRFAPPQQFQPVPDAMLASQRSDRVATRALVWGIVAIVLSAVPLLNWFTLVPAIVAIQFGIAARAQRLGGGSRAVWAIVLGSISIVASIGWIILHIVILPVLLLGGLASTS
ncbi:hypothetical protein [Agrococcus sp. SGAir0287]|uniref:hypothetical protein n=1 Tax=Agrococcus sp. SGAir0287 TaxID=2070347 RepID=UPI0010CCC21F|nr:hypothetical protein [Agrococcus sp. SGAir0287]QCR20195.1 hypothetical protein C1N71_12720 [Agrococcus sp. SGAir0287]